MDEKKQRAMSELVESLSPQQISGIKGLLETLLKRVVPVFVSSIRLTLDNEQKELLDIILGKDSNDG